MQELHKINSNFEKTITEDEKQDIENLRYCMVCIGTSRDAYIRYRYGVPLVEARDVLKQFLEVVEPDTYNERTRLPGTSYKFRSLRSDYLHSISKKLDKDYRYHQTARNSIIKPFGLLGDDFYTKLDPFGWYRYVGRKPSSTLAEIDPYIMIPRYPYPNKKKKSFKANMCVNNITYGVYNNKLFEKVNLSNILEEPTNMTTLFNILIKIYNTRVHAEDRVTCLLDIPIEKISSPLFSFDCSENMCRTCAEKAKKGGYSILDAVKLKFSISDNKSTDYVKSMRNSSAHMFVTRAKGLSCIRETLTRICNEGVIDNDVSVSISTNQSIGGVTNVHRSLSEEGKIRNYFSRVKGNGSPRSIEYPYVSDPEQGRESNGDEYEETGVTLEQFILRGVDEFADLGDTEQKARYEILMRVAVLLEKLAPSLSESMGKTSFFAKDLVCRSIGKPKDLHVINWTAFCSIFPIQGMLARHYRMLMAYHPYFMPSERVASSKAFMRIFTENEFNSYCSVIDMTYRVSLNTRSKKYLDTMNSMPSTRDDEIVQIETPSVRVYSVTRGHFIESNRVDRVMYEDVEAYRQYLKDTYKWDMSTIVSGLEPDVKLPSCVYSSVQESEGNYGYVYSNIHTKAQVSARQYLDDVRDDLLDFIMQKQYLIPDNHVFINSVCNGYYVYEELVFNSAAKTISENKKHGIKYFVPMTIFDFHSLSYRDKIKHTAAIYFGTDVDSWMCGIHYIEGKEKSGVMYDGKKIPYLLNKHGDVPIQFYKNGFPYWNEKESLQKYLSDEKNLEYEGYSEYVDTVRSVARVGKGWWAKNHVSLPFPLIEKEGEDAEVSDTDLSDVYKIRIGTIGSDPIKYPKHLKIILNRCSTDELGVRSIDERTMDYVEFSRYRELVKMVMLVSDFEDSHLHKMSMSSMQRVTVSNTYSGHVREVSVNQAIEGNI